MELFRNRLKTQPFSKLESYFISGKKNEQNTGVSFTDGKNKAAARRYT